MYVRLLADRNNGGILRRVCSGMMCIGFHGSSEKLLRISLMNFHEFVL